MKSLELLILLSLICYCFESKAFIRKLEYDSDSTLDDTDDNAFDDTETPILNATDTYGDVDVANSTAENIIPLELILIGFGEFSQTSKDLAEFNIYFYIINGELSSYSLSFPVTINYSNRLRALEEEIADCSRVDGDDEKKANYHCKVTLDDTKNGYSLSTEGKKFDFPADHPSKILLSYKANQTKEDIKSKTGSELKNALILNSTVLDEGDKTFTLYGNLTETINDKEITLHLENVTTKCSVNNLGDKSYEFTCTPNGTINEHLEGKYGITSSGKYIILHFADEKDDLLNTQTNSVVLNDAYTDKPIPDDERNPNSHGNRRSSRKLSKGAIAGLIIAAVAVLIIIGIILTFVCRTPRKVLVQESITQVIPGQSQGSNGFY